MHKAQTHILHFVMSVAVLSVLLLQKPLNTTTLDFASSSANGGYITYHSDGSVTYHSDLPVIAAKSNLDFLSIQQATPTQTVSQVQQVQNRVAQVNRNAVATCATCYQGITQKPPVVPNSCAPGKDYLEREIEKNLDSNKYFFDILSQNNQSSPFRACIKTSLANFGARVKQCNNPSGKLPKNFGVKSCVSEEGKYIDLTVNSFELASDCLSPYLNGQTDEQSIAAQKGALFTLLNHESGFHVNAVSWSGAAGIGQFISDGLQWVNDYGWNDVQQYINASNRPSCQKISDMKLNKISSSVSNSCERISLSKQQPLSGLVYTFVHKKMIRNQLEKIMTRSSYGQKSLSDLSAENKEYLLRELSNWGHNTGSNGITQPFEIFAASQRGSHLLAAGDMKTFMNELRSVVYSYTKNMLTRQANNLTTAKIKKIEDRAKEASGFYNNIHSDLKSVERSAGKSCNINTSGAL